MPLAALRNCEDSQWNLGPFKLARLIFHSAGRRVGTIIAAYSSCMYSIVIMQQEQQKYEVGVVVVVVVVVLVVVAVVVVAVAA